jgi:hypothetical protein
MDQLAELSNSVYDSGLLGKEVIMNSVYCTTVAARHMTL